MKKILVILFFTVFTLPSWSNDLKPVQNCKDIIFNNPELKVEVSDWELEFVSFFNKKRPSLPIDGLKAIKIGAQASSKKSINDLDMEYLNGDKILTKLIDWFNKNNLINN